MDERPSPATPRLLLICLAASLAGHAVVLFLVGRSEVSEPYSTPAGRTLLVELEQSVPQDDALGEQDLIEVEPETASEEPEPEPAMADAIAEPPSPDTSESNEPGLRMSLLDLRKFVKGYESSEDQPDSLPFRPDLRRGLEARQAEQRRVGLVDQNRADRFGHSAEIVNADGAMTKIGEHCYMTSIPAITIQRGQQVSQVECPGQVEWWKRSGLEAVATFRGIP